MVSTWRSERKEEILKPKEIKAEIEPAGAKE
jgi:hypothetical protein